MISQLKHLRRAVFAALALGGIALLSGCGNMNQSPLSSGAALAPQNSGGSSAGISSAQPASNAGTIVFSDGSAIRLSKPAGDLTTKSAQGYFSPRFGGMLSVFFPTRYVEGEVQVLSAIFTVKRNSIDQGTNISMAVTSGSSLNDISIAFTPSGLTFHPDAQLRLILLGKLDPSLVGAEHIDDQGHVTKLKIQNIAGFGMIWTVTLDIPGFSGYSLGGDDGIPAPEVPGPNGP